MGSALPLGIAWPESNLIPALLGHDQSFHAYVHIPFCEVRCGYCDFNTYTAKEIGGVSQSDFHESIIREIQVSANVMRQSGYPSKSLKTIFFGGGTPSLFSSKQIGAILNSLESEFGFSDAIEITTEANPESTSPDYLRELSELGVNRLSLGAQSFDASVLETLDRKHDPARVAPLVQSAKSLGMDTSIDLIYGAPGESLDSWKQTVEKALSLGSGHISAYSLIVEPGTKLARQIRSGELAQTDEDLDAEKYVFADRAFTDAGLDWYEFSNWGKPSAHNQAYWRSQNWWGYGPGAHSHLSGNRFWNVKHPLTYQNRVTESTAVAGLEYIDKRTHLEERLMLELRTSAGIPMETLSELEIDPELLESCKDNGELTVIDGNLVVTDKGRLFVDRIVLQLLTN